MKISHSVRSRISASQDDSRSTPKEYTTHLGPRAEAIRGRPQVYWLNKKQEGEREGAMSETSFTPPNLAGSYLATISHPPDSLHLPRTWERGQEHVL